MNGTVATLAELWDAVPIPSETWHAWSDRLRRLDEDVRTALDLAGDDTAVARALDQLVESDAAASPPAGTGRLAETRRLLAELPRPEGRHPYLDVIVPALEAAALLFAAVDASPAARTAFERERAALDTTATAGS